MFRITILTGILAPHIDPNTTLITQDVFMFAPRPMCRNVKVYPRYKPVPRLIIELNTVMPLTKYLHKLTGTDMILVGIRKMIIRLRTGPSYIRMQSQIRLGEITRTVFLLGRKVRPVLFRSVMTSDTALIKHRLDLTIKTKTASRTVPRLDRRWFPNRCHRPFTR